MNADELVRKFPTLYHMAKGGAWPQIAQHGLLSTSALLDLFECAGEERAKIETQRRPHLVPISHSIHGVAEIRDQHPMDDGGLARCLQGMTPQEWYQLLNRKVFFWATEHRLLSMINCRAYRENKYDVLIVDTASLVEAYSDTITLSRMNTGCTKPYPHDRGPDTFMRIPDYPYDGYLSRRKRDGHIDGVVEVAVDYSVPDIVGYVHRVEQRRGRDVLDVIWKP